MIPMAPHQTKQKTSNEQLSRVPKNKPIRCLVDRSVQQNSSERSVIDCVLLVILLKSGVVVSASPRSVLLMVLLLLLSHIRWILELRYF